MSNQTQPHLPVLPPLPGKSQPPQHPLPKKKTRMGWIIAGTILGFVVLIAILAVIAVGMFRRKTSLMFPVLPTQQAQQNTPGLSLIQPTSGLIPTESDIPTQSNPYPVVTEIYGYSVLGRPLESTCIGNGSHVLMITTGLHGDENNPRQLVDAVKNRVLNEPTLLPMDTKLCFITNINPDGAASNSRFNADNVDLNRNWDTNDWASDIERGNGIMVGGGGSYPQSEPEVYNLGNYMYNLNAGGAIEVVVVFYHSTVTKNSDVRPGYWMSGGVEQWDRTSVNLAKNFASATGYVYSTIYGYPITGESLHWMADQGFTAFGIEMPNSGAFDSGTVENHLNASLDILRYWY